MMQAAVRVSVCVATYNQAAYIEDCVLSVLAQAADADIELLVGDDGSTDGTGEILQALERRHPGRIVVLRREANLGPAGNYQDLVGRATGRFIAHLDGDDAWLPGKLRAQIAFLSAHPECPAVYTNAIAVETSGRLVGSFTNAHPRLMSLSYLCARGNYLMHGSMLYRAQWKDDFLRMSAPLIDYAIHLAFSRHGPLGFIDEPLALYRVATATSMVRNSFPWVQRQLWDALKEATRTLAPTQRRRAIAHFVGEALLARAHGKTASVRPLVREAAAEAGCSRGSLLLAAAPAMVAVTAHGVLRSLLRRIRADARMAQHYRV